MKKRIHDGTANVFSKNQTRKTRRKGAKLSLGESVKARVDRVSRQEGYGALNNDFQTFNAALAISNQ